MKTQPISYKIIMLRLGWNCRGCFCGVSIQLLLILLLSNCESNSEPIVRLKLRHSTRLVRLDTVRNANTVQNWVHGNLYGEPGEGYYMDMGIGTPPQIMQVLVDTGSSNYAVAAAAHPFIPYFYNISKSSTYKSLDEEVRVPYTQGEWDGDLGTDIVTIPSLPKLNCTANIAGITRSENFYVNGSHWQGILGMAYDVVARPDSSLQPFFDSLVEQTGVKDIFSMQLCGPIDITDENENSTGGTMTMGGIDSSLYTGEIRYAQMNRQWYYEVVITSIAVGNDIIGLDCKEFNFDKTIVDSGTTNLRFPVKVYDAVTELITTQSGLYITDDFLKGESMLCWKRGEIPYDLFPNMTIHLAISTLESMALGFGPRQYLRPVPDSSGDINKDCVKYAVAPSKSGTVLGAVLMEAYYVVFDRANERVGFARSTCQKIQSSDSSVFVKGPFNSSVDPDECAYHKPTHKSEPLMVAAYIMGGVCILALIPLVVFFINWQFQSCKMQSEESHQDFNDLLSQSTE